LHSNYTPSPEPCTLSLHDALPISMAILFKVSRWTILERVLVRKPSFLFSNFLYKISATMASRIASPRNSRRSLLTHFPDFERIDDDLCVNASWYSSILSG